MYLIKHIIVFVFIVIIANTAYSQKNKNSCYDFDLARLALKNFSKVFLSDTTLYIYTDSNIVNGLFVYTDSIKVDISSKNTSDTAIYILDNDIVIKSNGFLLYKIHYPITLKDNPLFKKAVYFDENCLMPSYIEQGLHYQREESENKKYCILSSDGRYINYAFLTEKDGDLYTKYDPFNKDNSGIVMTVKRKKMRDWLRQKLEMNKVISITRTDKVYIVKLFSN